MEFAEKLEKIEKLNRERKQLEENIARLVKLNVYDHTGTHGQQFFVEFGGGSTHVKEYIRNNEFGDLVTDFFVGIWTDRREKVLMELEDLIK